MEIEPKTLIQVLNRAGVNFVLMGAHVVAGWSRVHRATEDVDALVQKSHHRKAVEAVRRAFPTLTVEDNPVVTRFRDPSDGRVAIDLMKPVHEIYRVTFRNTVLVEKSHKVPPLVMLLACKFAAMTSPNRLRDNALVDGADFIRLVQHNKHDINRVKLRLLGETVYQGGGGLLKLVDDVLAGRPLVF